jgi:hypothetical protein
MTDSIRMISRGARVRGLVAAVSLCVLLAASLAAAPAGDGRVRMDRPVVVLTAGDAGSTDLAVRFPVKETPADWDLVSRGDVVWRGVPELIPMEDGTAGPAPMSGGAVVALSSRTAPHVAASSWTWLREPSVPVDVAGQIDVGPVQILRGVPVVSVRVRPETPGDGLLGEVRLTVRHAPDRAGRAALDLAAAKGASPRTAPGAGAVANPDLYQALHDGHAGVLAADSAAKAEDGHPFQQSDNWLRIEIAETGAHRLSGFHTSSAGVDPATVDPATVRLYRAWPGALAVSPEEPGSWQEDWSGLEEIAVDMSDVSGTWASTDEMRFYAVGPDAWTDRSDRTAGRLEWSDHPYSNVTVYWMTWEDFGTVSPFAGDPLRIETQTAAARGVTPTTHHRKRLHLEEQIVAAHGRLADDWAWTTSLVFDHAIDVNLSDPVPDSPAFFQVELRSQVMNPDQLSVANTATVRLNADAAHAESSTWTPTQEADSLQVRIAGWSDALRAGPNSLLIERVNAAGAPVLMVDSADLLYDAQLIAAGQTPFVHWGDQVIAVGAEVDLRIIAQPEFAFWDVSDPLVPIRLIGTSDAAGTTLGLVRGPGSDRHFVAYRSEDLIGPVGVSVRSPGALRSIDRGLDYVLIHAPEFASAAAALGAHRSSHLPGAASPRVAVVDADDVYDAFGGGVRDPLALRNFLKWVWSGSEGRLAQVCFMGDASRDYRNFRNASGDLLPTWLWKPFPGLFLPATHREMPFATDDVLTAFEAPLAYLRYDVPDLISGRLTVQTPEEAARRVAALIAYDSDAEAGNWRNRIVMAADDLKQPSSREGSFQPEHTKQAEDLIDDYAPASLDVRKVYLVDYDKPDGVAYKPAARQQARTEWNQGLTMFHYIGHGADNTLADEQLFLTDDIFGLTNGMKRGLFLAFSCDVGIYDQITNQSMAETWTSQPEGGAIGAIAASQVSYISANDALSDEFYQSLFPGRLVDNDVTPARALWEAKVRVGIPSTSFFLSNAVRYLYHGDPGTALPHPESGMGLHAASADSLRGGRREDVVLVLSDHGIPVGPGMSYDLLVQEARDDRTYDYEGRTIVAWWRPGAVVFRGSGPVDSDTLRVPFKVPLQLRYGDTGRVRLMVGGDGDDQVAAEKLWVAQAPTGAIDDAVGPVIDMAFADDRYRVKAGTELTAALTDTSGISIVGSNPLNSVQVEIDGDGRLLNVSDSFVFDPGSYTTGRVTFPLPNDIETGRHELAMYASDVLGNVGSDTISFMLVADAAVSIDDVTVFPNPTTGPARLLFEISDPMNVSWTLYTLAGHRVAHMRGSFGNAGPQILAWDGRDDQGDEIANGVYLYVMKGDVPDGDGHPVTVTGQLVMMR